MHLPENEMLSFLFVYEYGLRTIIEFKLIATNSNVMLYRLRRYDAFASQIFHSKAISLARRANFVEKSTHCLGRQMFCFCWLKRDKRCLNKGNCEQKVSDSMTVQCDAQWDNMFPNLHLFWGIA